MAVLQMQHIQICALKSNRKRLLEFLQRRGVVELIDGPEADDVFQKDDVTPVRAALEREIQAARRALEVLERLAPEKTSMLASLNGRTVLKPEVYDAFEEKAPEVAAVAARLDALEREIGDRQAEILKTETAIEALQPWVRLDISMQFGGTRKTAAFIGSLPEPMRYDEIVARLAALAPDAGPAAVEIISTSNDQTCIFLLTGRPDAKAYEDALRAMGFARPASATSVPPAEQLTRYKAQIADCRQAIESARQEIIGAASCRGDLKFLIDYDTMRIEKYGVIGSMAQSKSTFILDGYIPKMDAERLQRELESRFDAVVSLEDPDEDADVPVKLKNGWFSDPVESVVDSFSLPGKGEIDPTSITAVFYYVLFGLMLSDAAYGAMLFFGCWWATKRFPNMEIGMRRMLKLFQYSGLATIFWGFIFGSFFGDIVTIVGKTFFGADIAFPTLWFSPTENPMLMLVFSMGVGVVHLYTGLICSFYQHWKNGRYKDAIYDTVFWLLLITGLILMLIPSSMFQDMSQIYVTFPPFVNTAAVWMSILGAIGIVLTGGRDAASLPGRIASGLYSLYGATSWLSDILSYSRLLALGLATGVIASVVNQMGSMLGGGVVGAIVLLLVFIIGQLLNFGINLLGSYVHTNRLQYVEFYGKFYEGGGRPFSPFGVHTKYFKFEEDK